MAPVMALHAIRQGNSAAADRRGHGPLRWASAAARAGHPRAWPGAGIAAGGEDDRLAACLHGLPQRLPPR